MKMLRFFQVFVLFSILASCVSFADENTENPSPFTAETFQPLGDRVIGPTDTLRFGGSFGPITTQHMGIAIALSYRFGFYRTTFDVAKPYTQKEGAETGDVNLHLTRVGVSHFNEALHFYGAKYNDFRSVAHGISNWTGKQGRIFTFNVDGREIERTALPDAKPDPDSTLNLLKEIAAEAKDPKKVFWASGGDSFASIPTKWGDHWRELFDHANWIVMARPGYDTAEDQVNFNRKDPLRKVLGEEFINQYEYAYIESTHTHVYNRKGKPSIYVIDQPMSNISSTLNRKSLQQEGDHEYAQYALTPSVFMEIIKNGWFKAQRELFTQKNLEILTDWFFTQVSTNAVPSLSKEQSLELEKFSKDLLEDIETSIAEDNKIPEALTRYLPEDSRRAATYLFFAKLIEHTFEGIKDLRSFKKITEKVREVAAEYHLGKFAVLVGALEIVELPLVSWIMVHLYGAKGLLMAPAIHPNEQIIIPMYLITSAVLNWYKKHKEKIRVAGNVNDYELVQDYLNRLLRGDPDSILMTAELKWPIGIGGKPITLNVVESRLPKWVPLFIRNWDDSKVTWYDLNVSTNELKSLLQNDEVTSSVQKISGENPEKFAWYMLAAVLRDSGARTRLELFLGHRYFQKIAFTDVPKELFYGFNTDEKKAITELAVAAQGLENKLGNLKGAFKDVKLVLADAYAILRSVSLNPENLKSDVFWTEVVNLAATRYPGKSFAKGSSRGVEKLASHIRALSEVLYELSPDFFNGVTISHRGVPLLQMGAQPKYFHPSLAIPQKTALVSDLTLQTARYYVVQNRWVFEASYQALSEAKAQVILQPSLFQRVGKNSENLVWDIQVAMASIGKRKKLAAASFKNAWDLLKTRDRAIFVKRQFKKAHEQLWKDLESLKAELKRQKFQWGKRKLPGQATEQEQMEFLVPGYDQALEEFGNTLNEIETKFSQYETLEEMIRGNIPLNLKDRKAVKKALVDAGIIKDSKKTKATTKPCLAVLAAGENTEGN